MIHRSKFVVDPKTLTFKGHCFCDSFFEAFKNVEHAAPDSWHNLTGGPMMSLMTVDLRMPNCRYRHACTCLTATNICTMFLVTQAALMAGCVQCSCFLASLLTLTNQAGLCPAFVCVIATNNLSCSLNCQYCLTTLSQRRIDS